MEFFKRLFGKNQAADRSLPVVEQSRPMEQLQPAEQEKTEWQFSARTLASEKHLDHNEDRAWTDRQQGFFAVLDGMGGMAGGEQAATVAMQALQSSAKSFNQETTFSTVARQLQLMLQRANQEVLTLNQQPDFKHSGSTLSLARIYDDPQRQQKLLSLINVGDSRIYRWRGGELQQLSQDDDIASLTLPENQAKLARAHLSSVRTPRDLARLSPTEQDLYRRRNMIANYLGMEDIKIDQRTVVVQPQDQFFIFSDGVTDNLTDQEMTQIVQETGGGQKAVDILLQYALAASRMSKEQNVRAKSDDMTAVNVAMMESKHKLNQSYQSETEKRISTADEGKTEQQSVQQEIEQTGSVIALERKVAELFDRGVTFKNYTAEQVEQQIEMAKYRYVTTGDIEQAAAMVTRANGLRDYVRNLFPESLTISVRVEKNNY